MRSGWTIGPQWSCTYQCLPHFANVRRIQRHEGREAGVKLGMHTDISDEPTHSSGTARLDPPSPNYTPAMLRTVMDEAAFYHGPMHDDPQLQCVVLQADTAGLSNLFINIHRHGRMTPNLYRGS